MTHHFYTDPLAAAWMAKHFGMRFVESDMLSEMEALGRQREWEGGILVEHVIHPDSLHLLEPQDLDILYRTNGYCQTVGVHIGIAKTVAQIAAGACIIQRNGKAFHWPEEEAA